MSEHERCALCGHPAPHMIDHLQVMHPSEHWGSHSSSAADVVIGAKRSIAYALAIWPTDAVSRSTLRALLPPGERRNVGVTQHLRKMESGATGRKNVVTDKFQKALYTLERSGAIQRGDVFVLIRNRRALLDFAVSGIPNPTHGKFLDVERAAEVVASEVLEESRVAVRARREMELAFIRELMKAPDSARGSMRSGARAVRGVPGSRSVGL